MIEPRLAKIKEEYVNSAAYHEAGHAVIAAAQGLWLRERGMHVDPEGNGITYYCHRQPGDLRNSEEDQQEREETIMALHAGRIAQVKFFSECPDANWVADLNVIGVLMNEMCTTDPNARSIAAKRLQQQAQQLVDRHWIPIRTLATELLSKPWTEQRPIEIKEKWSRGNTRLERWLSGSEIIQILSRFGIVTELRGI